MELPGGIEKDELGVALSYAIMLGGGAPSAPNGAAKSTPAVQPAPGQSKKAAKKEAKALKEQGRGKMVQSHIGS